MKSNLRKIKTNFKMGIWIINNSMQVSTSRNIPWSIWLLHFWAINRGVSWNPEKWVPMEAIGFSRTINYPMQVSVRITPDDVNNFHQKKSVIREVDRSFKTRSFTEKDNENREKSVVLRLFNILESNVANKIQRIFWKKTFPQTLTCPLTI